MVRVGNREELVISTIAATIGIVTSMVGWAGILLNNRGFLAWYTFMLWISFAFLVTPGYIAYKKRTFNLEGKLNKQWSQSIGAAGRLSIQNQLMCCGYYSPFVLATVSQTCYARTVLPGCKGLYMRYERAVLRRWFNVAFALVPLHLFVMVSALLCSNHVTYRFGKGMTPKAYRLDMSSMAVIMDNYAKYVLSPSPIHPFFDPSELPQSTCGAVRKRCRVRGRRQIKIHLASRRDSQRLLRQSTLRMAGFWPCI